MPVHIIGDVVSRNVPTSYYLPLACAIVFVYLIRGWSYGKRTDRERDMHGRTVLVTGATSSLGITLVTELARRGAQVVAVVPDISDPACQSLIDLVRYTTKNELVYAEQCDLSSPDNIKDFCAKLIKASGGGLENEPPRLDAVVFAHEYPHIGVFKGTAEEKRTEARRRLEGRLATFFFTTLLLPVLLTAPQERDIRFINIVSPFYSAAIPSFKKEGNEHTSASGSVWIDEGRRSLLSILFTRHLQRILDALPSPSVKTQLTGSQQRSAPNTSTNTEIDEEVLTSKRPSNIIAVAVSPGISRWDTVAPFMRASRASPSFSHLGLLCYILASPLLYLLTKSSEAAVQSVLHALFLPSSIKANISISVSQTTQGGKEESVQGGALYAECERVQLPGDAEERFGGEGTGQSVWEQLEVELSKWRRKGD
ncbi:hypothetical protein CPB86DRAFT_779499 [Serendipita vermifera]|nr:hypothetical protein CPB86DRAFT_779499 [Serendipita vermifera]